ncbi:MAG: YfcC family protein [Gemmatimonadetes bacterium]|nr:YfcC family protein [Gemmatimonadota bacterium]MEC9354919.1 YfcC family protein [Gemmatimonadota bacterium]|tara:strand:- start:141 stop:1490 length:1350 start_codon:yes stop_codon:yes gene_type:complete
MTDVQHRFRVPHPLVLLTGCIILASMASYVLPAGEFERSMDEETGKIAVVAGTYQQVEQTPVNLFLAMVALPRGMVDAGGVIFLVFLIGGALTVVDETGALRRGISSLVRALKGRDLLIIAAISLFFATGGVVQNMQEEIIPLIPVVLIVTSRLGFTPLVAMAISAGAAFVGSAFSPINPFQVLIAQDAAGVIPVSGWAFRVVFLLIALVFWIGMTMRYAVRTRVAPEIGRTEDPEDSLGPRDWVILSMLLCTFVLMGYLARIGFNHMSAAFFIMGVLAGAVSGMGPSRIAQAYVNGFRQMAYAALLIGFARTIYVVLLDGRIIDTIVYGMFQPLESLPSLTSALGMVVAQAAIHVPIPSVSSQAVLTMPVLIPLSDLLEISRQVTVLAYQYGAGLCDLVTPTNGALMAILAAAGVRYEDWIKFTGPLYLGLIALGAVSIAVGISINLQ